MSRTGCDQEQQQDACDRDRGQGTANGAVPEPGDVSGSVEQPPDHADQGNGEYDGEACLGFGQERADDAADDPRSDEEPEAGEPSVDTT